MSREIRFYAELNDFLAPDRRQRVVRYPFEVSPSVKDAIEALGVPHTEVSVLLSANGDPIDFAYRLADGDRISVFPAFETFDVSLNQPRAIGAAPATVVCRRYPSREASA